MNSGTCFDPTFQTETPSTNRLKSAPLYLLLVAVALVHWGCGGATCERVEKERTVFLSRTQASNDTHLELTIPFVIANRMVEPYLKKIKPIEIPLSGLGNIAGYFGTLSVVPTNITMKGATEGHIGFHLDFEVQRNGSKAFGMFIESEVQPQIDMETGEVTIGFTPGVLQKATPGLAPDAKQTLGDTIYATIPGPARLIISRSLVSSVVDSALNHLLSSFYSMTQSNMLKMSEISQITFALPNVPLSNTHITSTDENGGRLQLALTTTLPVRNGIAPPAPGKEPSRHLITIRTSGSVAAELVNWAMAKGKLPNRYDSKGKAKDDGAFWPGVDWVKEDEQPMKIYLWDTEKPCMRLAMSAKPTVAVRDGNIEIEANAAKADDVDATTPTKMGIWFKLLWKDAINLKQKKSSKIKMKFAGKEMIAVVDKATINGDEFIMETYLMPEAPPTP